MTKVRQRYGDWPSDLPVLFLQGGADTMVDPVINEAWFKAVCESSAKDLVEIKIYWQASHDLLKGQFRSFVLQDVLDFINKLK
jgi:alpha-beta hydrolase superfamily lysophospholipase